MQFNSLQEWLGWLEQCHPVEIDLGLDRIRVVAERLDLLAPAARVVTVAGTNGKGSCVAAVAALLREADLHVGVYTSPHLLHYNERIVVDGVAATDIEICAAFKRISNAAEGVSLTYFEFGTLAALEIFQLRQVEVMVLEVGLGGRLDAVNIVNPDVAVITGIDLDHQDWLGHDREAIGGEKAGIVRAGQPAICADPRPPASIGAQCDRVGAHLYAVNERFGFSADGNSWNWWGQGVNGEQIRIDSMPLPNLPLPSLAAALQATVLLNLNPSDLHPGECLAGLQLPGRFQRLNFCGAEVILDVAHNPAASAYLSTRLRMNPCQGRTYAIVGMMADKDRVNSLRNLDAEIDSWYLADLPSVPRAATAEQLAQDLSLLNRAAEDLGTVAECLALLRQQIDITDRIVIWGSFYTVAAAMSALRSLE